MTLGGVSEMISLGFMSRNALPIFSSKSFIVASCTFSYLILFEFLCVCMCGVSEYSNFILLNIA